jgi:hypothetical protein
MKTELGYGTAMLILGTQLIRPRRETGSNGP